MKSIVKVIPGKSISRIGSRLPDGTTGIFYSPKEKAVGFYCHSDGMIGFAKDDGTVKIVTRRLEIPAPAGACCDRWGIVLFQSSKEMLWGFDQSCESGARMCGARTFSSMATVLADPGQPPYGVCRTGSATILIAIPGANVVAQIANGSYRRLLESGKRGFLSSTVASSSMFDSPCGVCFDPGTDTLFVSDTGNGVVRAFRGGKEVSFLGMPGSAGFADGVGTMARFWSPSASCCDRGNVAVCDRNLVRTFGASSLDVGTPYASSGTVLGVAAWDGATYVLEET